MLLSMHIPGRTISLPWPWCYDIFLPKVRQGLESICHPKGMTCISLHSVTTEVIALAAVFPFMHLQSVRLDSRKRLDAKIGTHDFMLEDHRCYSYLSVYVRRYHARSVKPMAGLSA